MDQDKIDFFLLSAHELRTSLTALKWLLKMLTDGDYGPLNPEQQVAIAQATASNETMVTLLNNTINTIKNNTAISYAKAQIHLASLIAEMIKEFTNEADEKHVALTYHQPATPTTVIGDETKLRIAFHNIIENAIKYSTTNTEVTISISTDTGHATVQIQDHGIGVPAEKVGHLFEKFFRAGNTSEDGTGLGLYSTKLIVEHHGGTIAITSVEGQGSTVTITLPLAV